MSPGAPAFHRDRFTWAAYGALLAFGFLNAVLGPILPYLRAVEHISYLVGALYGANLAGRLLASSLARWIEADKLLAAALVTAMVGLPILIAAQGAGRRRSVSSSPAWASAPSFH